MLRPPLIGVAPGRFIKGIDSLQDLSDPSKGVTAQIRPLPLDQAINTSWDTDAHLVLYVPTSEDDEYPRCNKACLYDIRDAEEDLLGQAIVLDWDTPGHKPWGETATQEDYAGLLMDAIEKDPLLGEFYCLYATAAGVRVVYALDRPVPVDALEGHIRWLVSRAQAAGLLVDELCDWTRLFRLPKVLRSGSPTEIADYFSLTINEGACLSVDSLGSIEGFKSDRRGKILPFDGELPDLSDSLDLMRKKGSTKASEWYNAAKTRLKNRECYPCLFESKPIAKPGARNTTIHRYVGQAIAMLWNIPGTTMQHIYGLFAGPIMQLDEDEDWLRILWSSVGRIWQREAAQEQIVQERIEQAEEEHRVGILGVCQGMKRWCKDEHLHTGADPDIRKLWVETKLIANHLDTYYLMSRDGTYRPQPYKASQLISAIRTHIPDLISTFTERGNGQGMKDESVVSLISKHTTIVREVRIQPSKEDDGTIEDMDRPNACLLVPGFRRNPRLKPEYSEEVEDWMLALFGEENFDSACCWIAYALAFEEGPICALSISGAPGSGKKMLCMGLAECLEYPSMGGEEDLIGDYQYGLAQSPFLCINEGLKATGDKAHRVADRFRKLTGGDPVQIFRKYMPPVELRCPTRILLTANNRDIIKVLAHGKTLSQDDRDALAVRLMHMEVGDGAANWLRSRGGVKLTSGWVSSDAGGGSRYVLAKHFLHLYESRRDLWAPGPRFLVQGRGCDDLMYEMQTGAGSAMLVIETILSMIDSRVLVDGIVKTDTEIFVVPSGILDFWRKTLSDKARGEKLDSTNIAKVLSGITIPEGRKSPFEISGHKKAGRRLWQKLDLGKLKRSATDQGRKCDKLDEIIGKGKHV